jgi:SET domain-containing protein
MIRVGQTANKGRGIFATRNISCGEIIEAAPVVVVPREEIAHLEETALRDYNFLWGDDEKDAAIMFGLCSLCNHSYEPNTRFFLRLAEQTIEFIALRDIAAGEEITHNYMGDPGSRKPVWFPLSP